MRTRGCSTRGCSTRGCSIRGRSTRAPAPRPIARIDAGAEPDPGSLRGIARLAVPALGALVAQPLFVLVDAAIVGTLGTAPLAGLGAAATIASLAVGLCVFLAYATTSSVARRVGEGRWGAAVGEGVDGMALGLGLGVASASRRTPWPSRSCARSGRRSW